ncbi:tetratricopeptide repeat protein [Paraflavitalea sp. CAU 1676]|nr:tetratricopeptide repeat protein [Paraflavitalea sp. CAU 1676]
MLLLCVFISAGTAAIAQTYTKADSAHIYQLLQRADEEAVTGSLDTAMRYAQQALRLSRQHKMLRGEGFAKLKEADILVQQSSTAKVNSYIEEATRIATQLKDSFMLALATYQQGQSMMYQDQHPQAEKLYLKALSLYFEKHLSSYTGLVYNDMGYMFGIQGELEQQAKWLLKSMRVYEQLDDLPGLATATSNMASVYHSLGNKEEAMRYTKQAITMREKIGDIAGLATSYGNLSLFYRAASIDSSIKYQEIATKYATKTGIKAKMIDGYDNMSVLMNMQKRKAEALEYIKKSIAICRELGDNLGLAHKTRWAALLCGDLKDTTAAMAYLQESYEHSQQLNNKTLWRDYYGSKAAYHKNQGDYRNAYDEIRKYYLYKDSLINEATQTNIAELQTQYETEKKDRSIADLNAQQKIKQLELEKQKAIIAGNEQEAQRKQNEIDLLVQSRQLQELKLKQQQEALEKQMLLNQAKEQKLQLAENEKRAQAQLRNAWIIGTILLLALVAVIFNRYQLKRKLQQQKELEKMRNDIARDLHDDIGSTLTSINILSRVSQNNLKRDVNKTSAILENITEQSEQIQQAMSDIVWAIKPDNDKLGNMVVRMREYVSHTLESKNIDVVFDVDKEILHQTLPMEQRRDFFLVFKEAVNNAAKYAQATSVTIRLVSVNNNLQLMISDNGKGFDTTLITSSNGLKSMHERARSMGATLQIQSAIQQGTSVKLQFEPTEL